MKRIFASSFCLLMSLFVTANLQAQQGNADAGQGKTALCAACHGPTGNAISPLFANLAGQGEKYLFKQLQDIQRGSRPIVEMTGMLAGFNDQDLADIAAYYASQEVKIAGSSEITSEAFGLDATAMLELGESIYRNGNLETGVPACSGCHSPTGAGNAPAGYPRLGGQSRDYLITQLENFRGNLRTNDGDTRIMRGVAENLSDLEIEAVTNYIAGLH
jgi:cytochrome c553